ncbi:MAG: TRAP transporter large permease [Burkholderiales bacterium]|nr:TRAP transporter large permease [Burkholderiales bacterium]
MILLFSALAVLLLIGAPVFVAIAGASIVYIVANGIPPLIAIQKMVSGVDSFPLLCVPFFVLAGSLMNAGSITDRLFEFAHRMVGHWRGGLGQVNVLNSMIFSGMSGTAIADAGGLGAMEIRAMRNRGYDMPFAVGISAASATMGPVIPPSLPLVVYGFAAGASVGQLFLAGIVPGLLMAAAMHAQVAWYARRGNYPVEPKATWGERLAALRTSAPALLMPLIIMGGIVLGVATPTEAAAVAAAYALLIGVFVYRSFGFRSVLGSLVETVETTSVVMLMVGASSLFGWILVRENAAQEFTRMMLGAIEEPWQALLILNLILLVAGMFLETIAIILIAVPIFMPVLTQFGIDPVHFGIVMVLNLMIGLMTPPVGLLLFVMARISGLDFYATFRACLPFLVPIVAVLILITFVPAIPLALPNFFMR